MSPCSSFPVGVIEDSAGIELKSPKTSEKDALVALVLVTL